ncbi:MAG: LysM peptidoglycan-binding domain-containing protein [Gemmatimonadota bacterium]
MVPQHSPGAYDGRVGTIRYACRALKMRIRLILVAACAAIAGCQTPSAPPKTEPPPAAAVAQPPPAPAPETKAVEGPPAGSPAAKSQAQLLLKQAAEHLNEGNEDAARDEIAQALALDPGNKTGACLQRSLTADPVESLGSESTSYTVRPGDTLGSIAQRALGESCEFYLLARYNQIRVPSRLLAGQVLKLPGKVALAAPERTTKPTETTPEPAAKPAPPADAASSHFGSTRSAMRSAEIKAQVERHQRNAIAAFRRQDLATAIKEWDHVLELDPRNDLARARRQEAIDLQRRLNQVK